MDLHDQLDELARATDIPLGDLDGVIAAGRRRQQRARRIGGALAAVALGASAVAVIGRGEGDDRVQLATEGPSTASGDLRWEVADPDEHLALYTGRRTVGDGIVYSLSTAPGQAPDEVARPRHIWASDDGISWRNDIEPTDELFLSELDAGGTDGALYAIGTGQAVAVTTNGADIPETLVGRSVDGETWEREALELHLQEIAEDAQHVMITQRDVAANDAGDVVAVVGVRAELDVPSLVPDGDPAVERWAITPTGVDVLGEPTGARCPDGHAPDRGDDEAAPQTSTTVHSASEEPHRVWGDWCPGDDDRPGGTHLTPQETHVVERSYTWDELGVDGHLLDAVLGRPQVFVAPGGSGFRPVPVPMPSGEIGWFAIDGGSSGFGLALTPTETSEERPVLLRAVDGTEWTSRSLPDGVQWPSALGHLDGASVVVGTGRDGRPTVVLGDGSVSRPAEALPPALVDGDQAWLAGAAIGELGVVVVLGVAGDDGEQVRFVVLTSRDGSAWSHHLADELAGADVSAVGMPVVTAERIVVPIVPDGPRDRDGHLRQRALVATAV